MLFVNFKYFNNICTDDKYKITIKVTHEEHYFYEGYNFFLQIIKSSCVLFQVIFVLYLSYTDIKYFIDNWALDVERFYQKLTLLLRYIDSKNSLLAEDRSKVRGPSTQIRSRRDL